MSEDDVKFAKSFDEGRRAATIGLGLITNPYIDEGSIELDAWIEGFASVDTSTIIPTERTHIFHLGRDAAERGESASVCPYMTDDEEPERMEIWLLGYAPYVDPELIEEDDVPAV